MLTSLQSISQDLVTAYFDNRAPVNVITDNGSAQIVAERLFSPHPYFTRSEYLALVAAEDEVTQIVAVECLK